MFSAFRHCCSTFPRRPLIIMLCAFSFVFGHAQDVDPNPPPLTQNMVKDAFVQALKEFADYGAGEDWRIVTLPTIFDDDFSFLKGDLETRIGANVVPYLQLLRALYPEFTVGTIYDPSKGYLGLQYNSQTNFFSSADLAFVNLLSALGYLNNSASNVVSNTDYIGSDDFRYDIGDTRSYVQNLEMYISWWDHNNGWDDFGANVFVQNWDDLRDILYQEMVSALGIFMNSLEDTMLGSRADVSTTNVYESLADYKDEIDDNFEDAEDAFTDPHLEDLSEITDPDDKYDEIEDLFLPATSLVSSGPVSYTITFYDAFTFLGFDIPELKVDYSFLMDNDCNFTLIRDSIYYALFVAWLLRFIFFNINFLVSLGSSGDYK